MPSGNTVPSMMTFNENEEEMDPNFIQNVAHNIANILALLNNNIYHRDIRNENFIPYNDANEPEQIVVLGEIENVEYV